MAFWQPGWTIYYLQNTALEECLGFAFSLLIGSNRTFTSSKGPSINDVKPKEGGGVEGVTNMVVWGDFEGITEEERCQRIGKLGGIHL